MHRKSLKSALLNWPVFAGLLCVSLNARADQKTTANDQQVAPKVQESEKRSDSEFVALIVDKTSLKASLVTVPDNPTQSHEIKAFTVAIGKEKGDKKVRGDNRTPEGIYMTEAILDDKALPAKYGPFAITLNYPNPMDRLDGKTGYGIWLHGVIKDERVEEANVTEGCVAFYNADIAHLTEWLRPYQGIVVIAESLGLVNRSEDIKSVRAATEGWIQAWAERRHDEYVSYYDEAFEGKGMNRKQYGEYKRNVFNSYKNMELKMTKVRVLTHPKYAISFMDQDFNGDNRFHSSGRKIIYWRKSVDGWKIVREVHENKRFDFVKFSQDPLQGKQAALLNAPPASIAN